MVKRIIITILLLTLVTVTAIGGYTMFFKFSKGKTINYDSDDEVYLNPYMGFAPDCDSMELCEGSSLVYMNLKWSDLEAEEGIYDWNTIYEENHLELWKSRGKHLVFRFVCDYPGSEEHMDIPQWLYDKTGDGEFYDCEYGKGYCPDYNNEVFIEAHKKVIKEIGDHFSRDDFLAYVELGSLGHWGEWHTYYPAGIPQMPLTDVRAEYVQHYVDSFPYAKLLMRRPFAEIPEGAGVFNDMTGDEDDTNKWLSWIEEGGEYSQTKEVNGLKAVPEIWNTAPVGGEFTSGTPMSTLLGSELDTTLSLLEESHMTFIGPKVPEMKRNVGDLSDGANEVLKLVGYRYRVSSLNIKKTGGSDTALTVTMCNDGVAPIYFKYKPCIYIYNFDESQVHKYELTIDLTKLCQDCEETCTILVPSGLIEEEGTSIYIGIEQEGKDVPTVYLNMDADKKGTMSLLWTRD